MLRTIRQFFDQHIAAAPDEGQPAAHRRARVAAAALLAEVVASDTQVSEAERQAMLESVQRRFALEADQASELVSLAENEAREAHDLFQFTSRINATYSPADKVQLIEELWRVAYADAALHAHEEHLIRRVADLLHVPHAAFISAKLRVTRATSPRG
jgi:uncharacterized tellurite resistance protein B-like protein